MVSLTDIFFVKLLLVLSNNYILLIPYDLVLIAIVILNKLSLPFWANLQPSSVWSWKVEKVFKLFLCLLLLLYCVIKCILLGSGNICDNLQQSQQYCGVSVLHEKQNTFNYSFQVLNIPFHVPILLTTLNKGAAVERAI